MTECKACGARSQVFLCRDHVAELSDLLGSLVSGGTVTERVQEGRTASGGGWWVERDRPLAGLLQHLQEAVVGQVRHGDARGPRVARRDGHLDGESLLASHIETFPNDDEPNLDAARRQRERAALSHALAQGRLNARAAEVLVKARKMLEAWVDDVAATTGVRFTPVSPFDVEGTALWVAGHAHSLANLESAGRTLRQATRLVGQIERAVNRPAPRRYLGRCPTWIDSAAKICGKQLEADEDAIEVQCTDCHRVHNCNRLQLVMVNDLAREKVTIGRILEINRRLPEDYQIPARTLRRWRKEGKLKPHGYRRPDGRTGIARHSDEDVPLYLWRDVEKLRSERWKVGAR